MQTRIYCVLSLLFSLIFSSTALADSAENTREMEAKLEKFTVILHRYEEQIKNDPSNLRLIRALADAYYSLQIYDKAVYYYSMALRLDPADNTLKEELAFSYIGAKEYSKASALLQELYAVEPQNPKVIGGLGRLKALEHNDLQAEKFYQQALTIDPDNTLVLFYLGELRTSQKQYEEAQRVLKKVLQLDSKATWAEAALKKAQLGPDLDAIYDLEDKGELQDALVRYQKLLDQNPDSIDLYMGLARLYTRMGQYSQGINLLNYAIKLYPKDLQLRRSLGFVYLSQGDLNQARIIFEQISEQVPKDAETLAGMGRVEAKKGDLRGAEELYRQALQADPNDILALSYVARLRLDEKRYEDAQKIFETILKIDPRASWAQQALVEIKFAPLLDSIKKAEEVGDYADAEHLYEQLIKQAPDHVDYYVRLARLYMLQKRYNMAIEEYLRAIEVKPIADLYVGLAYAYMANGDLEKSSSALMKALKFEPTNADAIAAVGRTYALLGDEESAQFWYEWSLQLNPGDELALGYLADLAISQKKYGLAQKYYTALLKYNPQARWAKQSYLETKYASELANIKVMEASNNIPGAITAYKDLLSKAPDLVDAYLGLGEIYLSQSQWKEAFDIFKMGLVTNPANPLLRVNLGLTYLSMGKLTQAQRTFDAVLVKNPINAEAITGLGKISEMVGDVNSAEYRYKQALRIDPTNLFALSTLARFYLDERDYDEAQKYYETILRLDPKASWAQQGLENAKFGPLLLEADKMFVQRNYEGVEQIYLKLIAESPKNPDYYVKLAQYYVKEKKYQEALVILTQGLSEAPQSVDLQVGLGYAYLKKGDLMLSQDAFDRAVRKNPTNAEAIAGLGQLAEARGRQADAEQLYKEALRWHPDNISALTYLAELKEKQGNYKAAEKEYKRLLQVDPSSDWVKLAIQEAKYGPFIAEIKKKSAENDVTGVETLYQQLLFLAPHVPAFYIRFGQFYHHNKQDQKAVDVYLRGIEVAPHNSNLYADLGLVYISMKKLDLARRAFDKSLKIDPYNPDALAGLGAVATMLKQYPEADVYIAKSLSIAPNSDAGLSALGNLRMTEKRYEDAAVAYKKLLDIEPKEKWIRLLYQNAMYGPELDRIKALAEEENYTEAAEGYADLIAKTHDNPLYYFGLGLMYLRQKEYSKAIDVYLEGIKTSPEEDALLVSLGYAYMFNKDYGSAKDTLEEALRRDPKNPETLAGLGQIAALEEDTEQAEWYFKRALNIDPINQSALSFYGALLMKQKRYDEAREVFTSLRRLLPKALWVKRVLQDAEDGPMMDLALCYSNANEFEVAAGIYQKLVDLSPEDPARYLPLGQMYVNMQMYCTGIGVYEEGLAIDSESPYLWRAMGFAYIDLQDYDTASCIFMYLLGEDYNDAQAWAGLGRIQALHVSECRAEEFYDYALSISPKDITTLAFMSDLRKAQGYNFSALQYSMQLMDIDPEAKWIRTGYNQLLNLTCPTIKGAGAYHAEYQWDPIHHRWEAQYDVYGGSILVNYPVQDDLTLWVRGVDEVYDLLNLEAHNTIYSFDVQRLYIGERWIVAPCFWVDAKLGVSTFSPHVRCSTFNLQDGWMAEPTIILTWRSPIDKFTFGFLSDAELIARDFSTNLAKLVARYYFMLTYEREIFKRTWAGIEGSTYWYLDYVHNTSQRASAWLQWRPPWYTDNILFRYFFKYQTFAHNIPDYYTYKPQYINQLQATLQKSWRVCWADTFYTSLTYGFAWQNTHTRFPNIIVVVPPSGVPPYVWDDRRVNTINANIIYTYDQLQVSVNGDWYRDSEKYTMWSLMTEVTWRF